MSATGPSFTMGCNAAASISDPQFIEHLSGISLNQNDPLYHRANQLMAVSFLNKMADSCSKRSLEHIAANPKTPISMLNQLACHHLEEVRVAVAENPSTPLDTLFALARDEQPDVRYCLAENTNMPYEILEILCQDENPYVCARAMRSLDIKKMLKRSSRFTGQTARLRIIADRTEMSGESGNKRLKRFISTLTNLKALS